MFSGGLSHKVSGRFSLRINRKGPFFNPGRSFTGRSIYGIKVAISSKLMISLGIGVFTFDSQSLLVQPSEYGGKLFHLSLVFHTINCPYER